MAVAACTARGHHVHALCGRRAHVYHSRYAHGYRNRHMPACQIHCAPTRQAPRTQRTSPAHALKGLA